MLARSIARSAFTSQFTSKTAHQLQHARTVSRHNRISDLSSASRNTRAQEVEGNSQSIFDSDESAWDHVFKDLDTAPQDVLTSSPAERKAKHDRPHQMTARELQAFEQMFDMVFQAVSEGAGEHSNSPVTPGIGKVHPSKMLDLTLGGHHHMKMTRWTSEIDQELDRKKEEMDLCDTDQQLLDWAMREVFHESQRQKSQEPFRLLPPTYPHLVALLIRAFRDKYGDPYLALSIFDHARRLSIASYVFGCTTHAYNELIETRWRCFRDLRGVCNALEEMRVNGIEMNTRTRGLVEQVRREIGEKNMWEEETAGESSEVWDTVTRIERLTISRESYSTRKDSRRRKWTDGEVWKQEGLTGEPSLY